MVSFGIGVIAGVVGYAVGTKFRWFDGVAIGVVMIVALHTLRFVVGGN